MALAINVNVSADQNSAGTITSPTFTAGAGEVIFALIGNSIGGPTPAITVSGIATTGLNWVKAVECAVQSGGASIWRAYTAAGVSSVTAVVTFSDGASTGGRFVTILSFTGADTTGTDGSGAVGNINTGNAGTGAPTASLNTTRNNSWVMGVGNDWAAGTARTLGSNQTMIHEFTNATNNDEQWCQRQTNTTPVSGTSVTINDTAPTTDKWNLAIVEILPANIYLPTKPALRPAIFRV